MKNPVDKVFFTLFLVVVFAWVIIMLLLLESNELLGIPDYYWTGGSWLGVILVIVGWFVVLWFRGRDSFNRDFGREATKADRVDRIIFWVVILLCVALVIAAVMVAFFAPDEIFGIPQGYWLVGLFFSPVLVIAVWVVVLWFRGRDE